MGISNPGGGGFTDILKWYDTTLAAPGRFDVTGIPQTYSSLVCKLYVRASNSGTTNVVYLLLNGDTTAANYRNADHAAGSSHTFGAADTPRIGTCSGDTAPAGYFGVMSFEIFRYASTAYKTIRSLGGERAGVSEIYARQHLYHWENTAPITQITLQPSTYPTDSFMVGSWLQIWLYK